MKRMGVGGNNVLRCPLWWINAKEKKKIRKSAESACGGGLLEYYRQVLFSVHFYKEEDKEEAK